MGQSKDRSEELRNWLNERNELSVNKIEKAAGLPFTTLAKVKTTPAGKAPKSLPHHHWETLEVVLRKYGWK